jgi:hypothetical protein
MAKSFRLPYEAELQSKNIIIVYDGNTSGLQENGMFNDLLKSKIYNL